MITKDNYEEYFLLYIDNELPEAGKLAVERFVADNPYLKEEWEALLQCRVHPDQHEVFADKEILLQQDLLSYIDGELDEEGRREVQEFINRYPSKAVQMKQLLMTVSHPDLSVRFPGKESLYRPERRRTLLPMPWMQAGVAAAILGIAALLLLFSQRTGTPSVVKTPAVVKTPGRNNAAPAHVAATAKKMDKKEPAAVTTAEPATFYPSGSDDHSREKATAGGTASLGTVNNETAGKSNKARHAEKKRSERTTPAGRESPVAEGPREMVRATLTSADPDSRQKVTAIVAETRPDAGAKPLNKTATTVVSVNIPKEQSSFATQALLEEVQADGAKDMIAAAPAGRNKLRGIFRRVSRALGKTADRDGEGQKEVLISAFQVALK